MISLTFVYEWRQSMNHLHPLFELIFNVATFEVCGPLLENLFSYFTDFGWYLILEYWLSLKDYNPRDEQEEE